MIQGERTLLRAIEREDLEVIWRWLNDREVMTYWGEPYRVATREEVESRYHDGMAGPTGRAHWLLITTLEGEPIGRVGYVDLDRRNRHTEIAIQIGEPAYWGRGYGTDALNAFLEYLFDGLNLHKVWLRTDAFNERARRAYEKCGFRQDGVLRAHTFLGGRYYDALVMSLLEDEYRARRTTAARPLPATFTREAVDRSVDTEEQSRAAKDERAARDRRR